ncbi:MAG TPA: hypothetical protein ENN87_16300 [Phycisphaerales bacterium]|nr:hypothetical protein [Phycisphaerales bacterium]
MRRFAWRLQRLLDIKVKQEDALRGELVAVTEQVVALRGRLLMQRAALRRLLAGLEPDATETWLERKRLALRHASVTEQQLTEGRRRLEELEQQRQRKMHEVMEVRKFRKRLERLRAQAYEDFMRRQEKRMQDETDDRTSVTVARRILSPA